MLLDALIILVLVLALYAGFRRGLLPPLLSEVSFFLTLLFVFRFRGPFVGVLDRFLPHIGAIAVVVALMLAALAGLAGSRLGRLLQRMPVVRGVDGFFGVFVHAALALAALYVFISALAAIDSAYAPLLKAATVTARQADQLRHALDGNPLTSKLIDSSEESRLQRDSRSKQGARIADYSQLEQVRTFYQDIFRPQLHGSRLAPLVLNLGSRLPLVGRLGTGSLGKA